MLFVYFILILLSLAILFSYYRYFKDNNLRKIAGPFPLPFVGNVLSVNYNSEKVWSIILDWTKKYDPVFRLWYFSTPFIVLTDPKDVKVLLTCKNNMNKANFGYEHMSKTTRNDGIIFSKAEKWRPRRKLIDPAFAPGLLKIYGNTSIEHVEKFVSFILSQGDEAVVELKSTIFKLTLGIVFETIMGVDFNEYLGTKAKEFSKAFEEYTYIAFYRTCRPYIQDWMVPFLEVGERLKQAVGTIDNVTNQVIEERRRDKERTYAYKNFVANEIKSKDCRYKLAFLDLLLSAEAENSIDDKGIKEETEAFLVAAYETTGTTLALSLILLAENKNAQDLAREEISNIMDRSGEKLNINDVNKLNYIERCIKETLRLYPSALVIGRRINEELQLNSCRLPVNSEAFVHTYAVHRNPKYWPDPDKFDPDRFLPEQIQNRHPYAYLPFSHGSRNCIGNRFAMQEIKIALANILYHFELEPISKAADVRIIFQIPLTLPDLLYIKFIKRR